MQTFLNTKGGMKGLLNLIYRLPRGLSSNQKLLNRQWDISEFYAKNSELALKRADSFINKFVPYPKHSE
jgi:hypothetical protein